jgi:hypothetical protein
LTATIEKLITQDSIKFHFKDGREIIKPAVKGIISWTSRYFLVGI